MVNREAVDSYYEGWATLRGDLSRVPLADDVEFISPAAALRGRDQVQTMAAQFGPVAIDFRVRDQFFTNDDTVVSVVEWELPGVEGTTTAAEILTLTDGVIAKAEQFYDPRLVLEFGAAANE
ncbi:hypothetical protein SSP35_57_00020 [Streptomyces sp. NBRC 110611]|uniref:nuclear transport factor 2 family protein n=1 Tax=Streptomyces sp. NBRC 110611 TaxID=1621259 RepID=UPI00082D7727|nr:nuclear transport factor 2 family protein [Streptomyces sp. NBRC 110611]GAU71614.1 hypothetical protein SSP35_57_00020 [Streptomyces sp. NBRC 110611]